MAPMISESMKIPQYPFEEAFFYGFFHNFGDFMTFCHGANVDNWVHANRPELFQLIEFELQIKFQFKIDYHRQKAKLHSICGIANSSRLLLTFMSILFTKYELCR